MGSSAGLDRFGNLAPTRIRSDNHPALSEILYWLLCSNSMTGNRKTSFIITSRCCMVQKFPWEANNCSAGPVYCVIYIKTQISQFWHEHTFSFKYLLLLSSHPFLELPSSVLSSHCYDPVSYAFIISHMCCACPTQITPPAEDAKMWDLITGLF